VAGTNGKGKERLCCPRLPSPRWPHCASEGQFAASLHISQNQLHWIHLQPIHTAFSFEKLLKPPWKSMNGNIMHPGERDRENQKAE